MATTPTVCTMLSTLAHYTLMDTLRPVFCACRLHKQGMERALNLAPLPNGLLCAPRHPICLRLCAMSRLHIHLQHYPSSRWRPLVVSGLRLRPRFRVHAIRPCLLAAQQPTYPYNFHRIKGQSPQRVLPPWFPLLWHALTWRWL